MLTGHYWDDVLYWVDHVTFTPDEIAVRFKHRIVRDNPPCNAVLVNGREVLSATFACISVRV